MSVFHHVFIGKNRSSNFAKKMILLIENPYKFFDTRFHPRVPRDAAAAFAYHRAGDEETGEHGDREYPASGERRRDVHLPAHHLRYPGGEHVS